MWKMNGRGKEEVLSWTSEGERAHQICSFMWADNFWIMSAFGTIVDTTLESEKEAVIRMLEETEEYRKIVEDVSGGSDVDVERKMRHWASILQERPRGDVLECGLRWAVEARRKRRDKQQEQRRQAKQGGKDRTGTEQARQASAFRRRQQLGKTGVENASEPEVMGRTTELRTGRGSTGLVRGGDERFRADETSKKGEGKGNGGKGEHEGKGGGFGHNGKQQEMREREEERVRMAPNMGAGGSHPRPRRIRERERWRKVMKKRKRF